MIDGIPKNTGNSYLVKGVSLPDNYAAFKAAIEAGTQGIDLNFNAAGWQVVGTLLSKANLLDDTTAAEIKTLAGLASNPETSNTSLLAIASTLIATNAKVADGVKIATGSYTGTGTYGESNPCSLTFDFVPQILIINTAVADGNYPSFAVLNPKETLGGVSLVARNGSALYVSVEAAEISWYTSESPADYQMNGAGNKYCYAAIG